MNPYCAPPLTAFLVFKVGVFAAETFHRGGPFSLIRWDQAILRFSRGVRRATRLEALSSLVSDRHRIRFDEPPVSTRPMNIQMLTLSLVVVLLLSVPSIANGAQQGFYPPLWKTRSAIAAECDDIKACDLPEAKGLMREDSKVRQVIEANAARDASTSMVVVYVFDVAGGVLPGMTVSVMQEARGRGRSTETAITDNAGMAALSLRAGQRYRIQVSGVGGWIPLTTDATAAPRSRIRLVRAVMTLPPIHH